MAATESPLEQAGPEAAGGESAPAGDGRPRLGRGVFSDPARAARVMAVNRAAIGSFLVLAPTSAGRGWIAGDARRPGTRVFARALGARDLGIALGTLRALMDGQPARPWARAAVLADGVDFLATLAARDSLPRGALAFALLLTGGSTALGVWLSVVLD